MGILIKLNDGARDYYLEYSTNVDAPVTFGLTLEEFTAHYRDWYGASSMHDFKERMKRVEQRGTSAGDDNADETIERNHAGKDGTCLTKAQMIQAYCIEHQDPVTIVGHDPWGDVKLAEHQAGQCYESCEFCAKDRVNATINKTLRMGLD